MINGILFLVLVLAIVKVSADVREDMDIADRFQTVQTQAELNELETICDEKEYFEPNCAVAKISMKLENGQHVDVSECDKIEYSGVPYYSLFQKAKWEETVELHKSNCIESINNWEGIMWD